MLAISADWNHSGRMQLAEVLTAANVEAAGEAGRWTTPSPPPYMPSVRVDSRETGRGSSPRRGLLD
jgi:hypothetical protein